VFTTRKVNTGTVFIGTVFIIRFAALMRRAGSAPITNHGPPGARACLNR
jgi:hypothetical protein